MESNNTRENNLRGYTGYYLLGGFLGWALLYFPLVFTKTELQTKRNYEPNNLENKLDLDKSYGNK